MELFTIYMYDMYDLSSNRGLYPVINPNWVWCMTWGCTTIVTIPTSSGLWTWVYPYFDPYYIPRFGKLWWSIMVEHQYFFDDILCFSFQKMIFDNITYYDIANLLDLTIGPRTPRLQPGSISLRDGPAFFVVKLQCSTRPNFGLFSLNHSCWIILHQLLIV